MPLCAYYSRVCGVILHCHKNPSVLFLSQFEGHSLTWNSNSQYIMSTKKEKQYLLLSPMCRRTEQQHVEREQGVRYQEAKKKLCKKGTFLSSSPLSARTEPVRCKALCGTAFTPILGQIHHNEFDHNLFERICASFLCGCLDKMPNQR